MGRLEKADSPDYFLTGRATGTQFHHTEWSLQRRRYTVDVTDLLTSSFAFLQGQSPPSLPPPFLVSPSRSISASSSKVSEMVFSLTSQVGPHHVPLSGVLLMGDICYSPSPTFCTASWLWTVSAGSLPELEAGDWLRWPLKGTSGKIFWQSLSYLPLCRVIVSCAVITLYLVHSAETYPTLRLPHRLPLAFRIVVEAWVSS